MAAHINSPPPDCFRLIKNNFILQIGRSFLPTEEINLRMRLHYQTWGKQKWPDFKDQKMWRASSLNFTGLTYLGQRDFKHSPSVKIHLCTCAMCIKHRSLNYQETKSNTDTVLLRWRECKNGKSRISSGKFLSYESVVKARKGLGAIKHKVVQPAGRLLNPFPAFSRPLVFLLANLFPVSSFVHRSVRVDGALKAGSGRR